MSVKLIREVVAIPFDWFVLEEFRMRLNKLRRKVENLLIPAIIGPQNVSDGMPTLFASRKGQFLIGGPIHFVVVWRP